LVTEEGLGRRMMGKRGWMEREGMMAGDHVAPGAGGIPARRGNARTDGGKRRWIAGGA